MKILKVIQFIIYSLKMITKQPKQKYLQFEQFQALILSIKINTIKLKLTIIFRAKITLMMTKGNLYERVLIQKKKSLYGEEEYHWSFHYYKILSQLEGSQEEKQAIVRKRILRYFGQFKLDSESYHAIRSDIDYNQQGVSVMTDKLVLFGIDYMTIDKAKKYFEGFATNIRRMDDSHYLIDFRSQNQCFSALNKKCICLQTFITPQDLFKYGNHGWIEMHPYYEFIFERKLMARFATNLDRVDNFCSSTKHSFSLAYSEAKRRFFKRLQEDLQTQQDKILRNMRRRDDHTHRSSSKQRSRQKKNVNHNRQNFLTGNKQQHYHQRNNFVRSRNFDRSQSRSRSPSLDMYDTEGNIKQPKLLQQQRIKESNFKFELYLKRRDKEKECNKTGTQSKKVSNIRELSPIRANRSQNQQVDKKGQRSGETNYCDIDVECIKAASEAMQVQNNDQMNNSEADFTTFLRNLKLSDSKNQYSAFDLEEMQ